MTGFWCLQWIDPGLFVVCATLCIIKATVSLPYSFEEWKKIQQCRPSMHNWGCNRNWGEKKSSVGICGLMYKIQCGLIPFLLLCYYSGGHCNTMTDCTVFKNHIQEMEKAAYFILFICIFWLLNIPTEKEASKSEILLCVWAVWLSNVACLARQALTLQLLL